jgi:hypothetical protein
MAPGRCDGAMPSWVKLGRRREVRRRIEREHRSRAATMAERWQIGLVEPGA